MKTKKVKSSEAIAPISIRLPEDIKAMADEFLKGHDTSMSNLIAVALFSFLNSSENERGKVFYGYMSRMGAKQK